MDQNQAKQKIKNFVNGFRILSLPKKVLLVVVLATLAVAPIGGMLVSYFLPSNLVFIWLMQVSGLGVFVFICCGFVACIIELFRSKKKQIKSNLFNLLLFGGLTFVFSISPYDFVKDGFGTRSVVKIATVEAIESYNIANGRSWACHWYVKFVSEHDDYYITCGFYAFHAELLDDKTKLHKFTVLPNSREIIKVEEN